MTEYFSFADYQSAIVPTAQYPGIGRNFVYPALALAEEAGEVAGKVKKLWRDQDKAAVEELVLSDEQRLAIVKELGDVLWYVARMSAEIGSSLEEVARENILKIEGRRERGTLRGSGDDR